MSGGPVGSREAVRLRHREGFTGVLVPLFRRTIDRAAAGFADFDRALRARAEERTGGAP